jgi:hypothetical protein
LKTKIHSLLILMAMFAGAERTVAQGTAFTYQGQLFNAGSAANGVYDLAFALYNADSNGVQVGFTVTNLATTVSNGLFSTTLNFGAGVFNGTSYWLALGVRTNGSGPFTSLDPRQQIWPVPYAIYASNAGAAATAGAVQAGSVTSTSIAAGTITAGNIAGSQVVKSLNGLHDAVTLAAGANVKITAAGNTLTVASSASGGGGGGAATNAWSLTGNAGTDSGKNFLGTTDFEPLEFHVHDERVMLMDDNNNIVGGYTGNNVGFVVNSVIAGGGGSYSDFSAGIDYTNYNEISYSSDFSVISGGGGNMIDPYAPYSVISGGESNFIGTSQAVEGGSVIAGGAYNAIKESGAGYCTISGGFGNLVSFVADFATIGGGFSNSVGSVETDYESFGTIAGGQQNVIFPDSPHSTIGGGVSNAARGLRITIGGGRQNTVDTSIAGTIAGGNAGTILLSDFGTIAGGSENSIENAEGAAIGGGFSNSAAGLYSVVPGGRENIAAGEASFAAGDSAQALYDNSFVWEGGFGDATNFAPDQFVVDAAGGMFINTSEGEASLNVGGGVKVTGGLSTDTLSISNSLQVSNGGISAPNGPLSGLSLNVAGTVTAGGDGNFTGNLSAHNFSGSSDRNIKDHFAPVNAVEILDKVAALPISSWNFKTEEATRHIGPMAQDFYGAFKVGPDDKHITTVDEGGVALAAIQGLNQQFQALKVELKRKNDENAQLQARLERLEKLLLQPPTNP